MPPTFSVELVLEVFFPFIVILNKSLLSNEPSQLAMRQITTKFNFKEKIIQEDKVIRLCT